MPALKPADALPQHWTSRLPARVQPYAQLSRWDRPVGWQLLFVPCLMGIALAETLEGFWLEDLSLALRLLVGAIAMRGAGCAWNDFLDRDIDAKVARTRARPLPSGRVTPRAAVIWTIAQSLVGLAILLTLPPVAQWVALGAIPLVALYPLMKRVTWWPQAWLGLCFSWGALVAVAAVRGSVTFDALALFAGCVAWVIAYDTIYALQDIEDDALVGVRSTARLFGAEWRTWTFGFYLVALALWGGAAALAGSFLVTGIALGMIGAMAIWPMVSKVEDGKPAAALAAFKANVWIGLFVAGAFALPGLWRTIPPFGGG
ncbi:MAG: 4-hydroxybenzoate octaprenyltransferase [Hyphomonadaceae bacterium]|nr:4-hydroxybenzoate octaprenyltransferase [Hyphomonadaceae bacterium]